MVELQKKAKGERPRYFADPAIEKVLSITLALAGEVAVLRDRLDTVERISAAGETVTPEAVDAYKPDADVRAARDAMRDSFLDIVLRAVLQEREDLERKIGRASYEEAIRTVEAD